MEEEDEPHFFHAHTPAAMAAPAPAVYNTALPIFNAKALLSAGAAGAGCCGAAAACWVEEEVLVVFSVFMVLLSVEGLVLDETVAVAVVVFSSV